MKTPLHTRWQILLYWLWLAGLMGIGLFAVWDTGLLGHMVTTDNSHLCALILIVFVLASLHCGWRSYVLAQEGNAVLDIGCPTTHPTTAVGHYLSQLPTEPAQARPDYTDTPLTEWLAEQLRGPHQVGWFIDSMLIKLGLLGTVVGFVIMLGSLSTLGALETSQVQRLMGQMANGMEVALNTTLFGLVGSLLLGIQYLYLDRCADQLLAAVIKHSTGTVPGIMAGLGHG